jgi:hypothetical protein
MTAVYNFRDTEPAHIRKHNERANVIKVYEEDWDTERGRYLRNIRLIVSEFPGVYTMHWSWAGREGQVIIPEGVRRCRFKECVNPCCYDPG